MVFAGLIAFIFLLALSGKKPTRGAYIAIAVAAFVVSIWEYVS
jgi:hypothetical protein